jgi:CxxC-x17-CxxC domain-containing protein
MNNFKPGEPKGMRNRREFIGGRPKSDAKYGPKSGGGNRNFSRNDGGGKSFGGNRDRDNSKRDVQMFKATCSTCGKGCEVPFKPDTSKPVLCSDCFSNKPADNKGYPKRDGFRDKPQSRPERSFESPRTDSVSKTDHQALVQQVSNLENKINQVLELLVKKEQSEAPEIETAVVIKKPRKVVVKKAVKKVAKKASKKK